MNTSLKHGLPISRRDFLRQTAVAAGSVALAQTALAGRTWSEGETVRYPDPDIISLDPKFSRYRIQNTPIRRLSTGTLWAEGPVWHAAGRYLVWSDIPSDRQLRWLDEDGHVSVFRQPSNNANGSTLDLEGRMITCEHATRRVVRQEHNGTVTVLAAAYAGKPLNAPNDAVVHPDGGIWFTDPGYGSMVNYEGHKGPLEIKEAVYRIDPQSGTVRLVTDDLHKPNGLCFSPDYAKLYVADSGDPKDIRAYDVTDSTKLTGGRRFVAMEHQGKPVGPDGIRADVDGNIWASAGWAGAGLDGVHVFASDGLRIGQIVLPEVCSNVCFGGPKRNRLFMTASQSLYAVYVETQGAHFC